MGELSEGSGIMLDPRTLDQIPSELVEILANAGNNSLDKLSQAALRPTLTNKIFTHFEPIFVGIAARWIRLDTQVYSVQVLDAFARILPLAPYLRSFALTVLQQPERGLPFISGSVSADLSTFRDETLSILLLALLRLLSFDLEAFSVHISPTQLQSLFSHNNGTIRYLSIRCFALYMHAADAAMETMIAKYHGNESIPGEWEGQIIDYRYLSLWEEKRWRTLNSELDAARKSREFRAFETWIKQLRYNDYVAEVGGVLVPAAQRKSPVTSRLVKTSTVVDNLRKLGGALLTPDPILLIGPAGSGKTSLVVDAAREMGFSSSMVTLHLNEQTDSKSLLGVYSTSLESGGFAWQPGVLTQAAKEGRWVLIEDLDRAPSEVLGLILPLVEKRELLIPSRKERIRCADGFRVLATMRSSRNSRGEEVAPDRSMLGSRLWKRVQVTPLPLEEVRELLIGEFPLLSVTRFVDVFLNLYRRIESVFYDSTVGKGAQVRSLGLRDLMKFCRRIERRLKLLGVRAGNTSIPESTEDEIFLDAVDCFAAYVFHESLRETLTAAIAESLNISPQRMRFCLSDRVPTYSDDPGSVTIGREVCSKIALVSGQKLKSRPSTSATFATTKVSLRTMEQVAAALQLSEPILLVGETGIGKTAVVQQLAMLLRQRLTVVNLSQQSETTDLLGGYKPVNLRSIAVSMVDEFNTLFESTFSAKKNQKFLSSVAKSTASGNWPRLINILNEAVKMASSLWGSPEQTKDGKNGAEAEQPSKKRKLNSSKYDTLRRRWESFANELKDFERRVSQGDSKFSFSFVQGKIVKALRNGEWVLLDEINLASPDTLESIASLLHDARDGGPSVLLSEAGDVERVYGHSNFRIFGAMNPATDAGKRDLAPGLRSRFTEIYVRSPDTEFDGLLSLIEAYLGPLVNHDKMAPSALANLYLETKKLNAENRLVDGAGQKPHFSVRTLVRSLIYVTDQAHVYGLRRAMYEGFCMSFLTLLSKESERQIIPLLDKYIFGDLRNARAVLSRTPREPSDGGPYVRFKHYWMRQGNFPPEEQPHYILTPFIERNLMNLVRASSTRRFPVLLQGPTSSGKTSMVEYLAKISGNRFVRINNHEHTDLQEYLGSYISGEDGTLRYQEGILVEALRNGYWIVLDELNLAPTDVLEALNRLLDDNRELFLPETQEVVRPHPNFMLFATQNPAGLYGGRKVLSRAFRNRFLELHFDDIPEDELEFILRERSQIAPSFCTRIVSVYRQLAILRQSNRLFEQRNSFATLRDLFRWAHRRADDREQLAIQGFMLLAERVRNPQERKAVKEVIEQVMKVQIDEKALYSSQNLESRLKRLGATVPAGIVWTQAMRRLFILVSEAIEHNEPVLLVGETGCGKTQLCQAVAEAYGKQLLIVNAHVNLETGDLIGAQRPLRNRTAIEQQLLSDISLLIQDFHVHPDAQIITLDDAKSAFNSLQPEQLEMCDKDVMERVRTNLVRSKALFEWSDGSLVTAMKSGDFFLLDELSLADDSVLERLNSVLEPHRSLLLAEKGPVDSLVVAKDGFQFLSTMNPGGDYGKRELSAALRNRMTEIWVPQLSEADDILPILESKLTRSLPNAPSAMLNFAKWFQEKYRGSSSTSLSIRDLLAWVNFVNSCESLETASALVHGACLVYVDSLGANPSAMLAAGSESLERDRLACMKKLGELLSVDALSIYTEQAKINIDDSGIKIGPFHLVAGSQRREDPNFALDAPTTLANTLRVARGLQSNKPILLEGSPGVGKTTLVATLANVLGKPLTRINLSEQTDLTDLFGSDVPVEGGDMGSFAWSDAPFLRAMQHGGWVLLDEMNLASQSVLEGLNSCLDHRQQVYVAELDQTFKRHPDFVLFAAQNPHHQGGGRKGLPASFVNRFTVVYADSFTAHDLRLICRKISPSIAPDRIERLVEFLSALNAQLSNRRLGGIGGPWELNLRDLSRWFTLLEHSPIGVTPFQFLDVAISHRFRTVEDRALVSDLYATTFREKPDPKSYFHNLSVDAYQVGLGLLARDLTVQQTSDSRMVVTSRDLPLMESLILCIDKAWPAILVGPSGCGKTALLRKMAALSGAKLVELALNSDTDAMDLIGGFEQRDIQRQVSSFKEELAGFLRYHIIQGHVSSESGDLSSKLLELYQTLSNADLQFEFVLGSLRSLLQKYPDERLRGYYEHCASLFQMSIETNKVGFEWTEGLLVHAIQQGDWVVLDNANLCNASVLDRLNSLMEPDGCLVINEQRTADGSTRIVKPHPRFRLFLTMDPRHGELSRAMRNRAVEICFLPSEIQGQSMTYPLLYTCESSIYRLRLLQNINWDEVPVERCPEVLAAAFEHLSPQDITSASASLEGLVGGLKPTPSGLPASSTLMRYRSLLESGTLIGWPDHVIAGDLRRDNHFLDCKQTSEPLHPLVNEPRVLTISSPKIDSLVVCLSRLQELQLDVFRLQEALTHIETSARGKKPSEMTALELSMISKALPPHLRNLSQPFAPFLYRCSGELAEWLRNLDPAAMHTELPLLLKNVFQFCWDIFRLSQSRNFDEPEFQTYLEIGRKLCSRFQTSKLDIIRVLSDCLEAFRAGWHLTTGQSMQRIWDRWRPATPSDLERLEQLLRLRNICAQFDQACHKVQLPHSQIGVLRNALVAAQTSVLLGADPSSLVSELSLQIQNVEAQAQSVRPVSSPYFTSEFEALCQYYDLSSSESHIPEFIGPLQLLAGRPSVPQDVSPVGSPIPSLLSRISCFSGFKNQSCEALAIKGSICLSLLRKLSSVGDVTLNQMDLLHSELRLLGQSLSSLVEKICVDPISLLRNNLGILFEELLVCHSDLIEVESLQNALEYLKISSTPRDIKLKASVDTKELVEGLLQETYMKYTASTNIKAGCLNEETLRATGEACVAISLTCLRLFVPSRQFDPSLNLVVERQRYAQRVSEVSSKLEGLRFYEAIFTGQASNLRIRVAEEDLLLLGTEPPKAPVTRPKVSQLGSVQGEFMNILNSVLNKSIEDILASSRIAANSVDSDELPVSLLQRNIRQICGRLSNNYPAYEDITVPVVRFLQLLDLGISLVRQSETTRTAELKLIDNMSDSIPFMGSPNRAVLEHIAHGFPQTIPSNAVETNLHRLALLSVYQNTNPDTLSTTIARQILRDSIGKLYSIWKVQLEQDQAKETDKSRLYRYRGSHEDQSAAELDEMSKMFPTFEGESEGVFVEVPSVDSKDLSEKLSKLVKCFFSTQEKESMLRMLVLDSAKIIGKILQGAGRGISCINPKAHLSAVLLLIDEVEKPSSPDNFNFYTDPNLFEVKKLLQLVEKILQRFQVIQKAWPEHATLADVITCCLQLLQFKHTEPLAKFITKTEQLHGFVHEWQVVASKEFSAADCYNDLTSLIIGWRRLELSTWARLLDIEKEKCDKDASAWWFIAYEVIIAVPLAMIEEGREQDLGNHTLDLVNTLEKFIRSTQMGQYSFRLQLIEGLNSLLDVFAVDAPALRLLSNALTNLLQHYLPFVPLIEDQLREGRLALEKDIKQEIQLASWKDTNITALRESARRSHYKLFKVVRKYRELLGEPCDGVLGKGLPRQEYKQELSARPALSVPSPALSDARSICNSGLAWDSRPMRFRDPDSSVENMRRVYQLSLNDFEPVTAMDTFIRDVVETIVSFRNKTPRTLTEDNQEEVQHLKTQKRRFYAEKLRDLRHMGIQSNLGLDILNKQSSVDSILATVPCLPAKEGFPQISSANSYFHRFLDLLPRVRVAGRNYSEDLSNVEAGRSAGFVEGLMLRIIKQREKLNTSLNALSSLDTVVKNMASMSLPRNGEMHANRPMASAKQALQGNLRWFSTVLGVCRQILQIQFRFAGFGPTVIIDRLSELKDECNTILSSLDDLPSLPQGISSSAHESCIAQARAFLQTANSCVLDLAKAHPEATFALEQLLPWTELDTYDGPVDGTNRSGPSAQEIDCSVLEATDKIFVVLQRLRACLPTAPASVEDQAWLTKSDQVLARAVEELHMEDITASITTSLAQLSSIPPENSGDFRVCAASVAMVVPIFQQYQSICFDLLYQHISLHRELCKMSYLLASSFTQIATEGFCSPAEESTEQSKSDKLESGTGLGDGEGAEDISKDVGDDEDLSDLAQEKNDLDDRQCEMEGTDDAVNMDQEDLEADASDFVKEDEEEDRDEGDDIDAEEEDLDEEVGSVDGLDSSAVDEKLWEGKEDQGQKDTENNEGKGSSTDDQTAAQEKEADDAQKKAEGDGDEDNDESEEVPDDEGEAVGREDLDVIDPHTNEEQVLDLPEDMELDGDEKGKESDEDDGLDDLSMADGDDKLDDKVNEEDGSPEDSGSVQDEETSKGVEELEEDVKAADNEEDQADNAEEDLHDRDLQQKKADEAVDPENSAPSEVVSAGLGQDQNEEKGASGDATQDQASAEQTEDNNQEGGAAAPEGEGSKRGRNEVGGTGDEGVEDSQMQAFRKLGDVLQEWHRRQQKIKDASEQDHEQGDNKDIDLENAEFEHLVNDEDVADTQALGQADEEQVKGMDQSKAVESDVNPQDDEILPDAGDIQDSADSNTLEDQMQIEQTGSTENGQQQLSSFIANDSRDRPPPLENQGQAKDMEEDLDNVETDLSAIHLSADSGSPTSPEEARRLWSHYEQATHDLSLSLTEQLRLILAPTMATKLRGDFRTGKRLNIKRIIPYIASQYKRDKIWMRRSVPSKRNYQIMLAVDDSKSMLENGSGQLAFETLALVSKSLSMLEVGDLCIVGFGNEEHIRVAHEFGKPFSSEAGMRVFQQFSYKQTGTNVRKLVAESIALFREARAKQASANRTGDLWQLQLIISDGICEEHDIIRRLVRQAQEERIMIVFIIVDAVADESRSIMKLTQASFELDESGAGDGRWKMKRYLDDFPFPYYLVVRDVQELPSILSLALKQWFAEVVEVSS
ncbi:hypothetical protein VTO42DRAFT_8028 [Malbranchea cinnamomea]